MEPEIELTWYNFKNGGELMPTISMFFGILVSMFYEDNVQHNTPHIHARYQGAKASLAIEDGQVLAGDFHLANFAWCRFGSISTGMNL